MPRLVNIFYQSVKIILLVLLAAGLVSHVIRVIQHLDEFLLYVPVLINAVALGVFFQLVRKDSLFTLGLLFLLFTLVWSTWSHFHDPFFYPLKHPELSYVIVVTASTISLLAFLLLWYQQKVLKIIPDPKQKKSIQSLLTLLLILYMLEICYLFGNIINEASNIQNAIPGMALTPINS